MTNILHVITSLPSFSCKMEGDQFRPLFFHGFEDGSKRLLQRRLLRSVQIGGNETARSLHMVAKILVVIQCPATVFPTVTIVQWSASCISALLRKTKGTLKTNRVSMGGEKSVTSRATSGGV